jgi:aspartate-semialdehyde dehydrogenase
MAVTAGRLRECPVMDCRFVALSHNTVRGAAGGAILSAELLKAKGYLG